MREFSRIDSPHWKQRRHIDLRHLRLAIGANVFAGTDRRKPPSRYLLRWHDPASAACIVHIVRLSTAREAGPPTTAGPPPLRLAAPSIHDEPHACATRSNSELNVVKSATTSTDGSRRSRCRAHALSFPPLQESNTLRRFILSPPALPLASPVPVPPSVDPDSSMSPATYLSFSWSRSVRSDSNRTPGYCRVAQASASRNYSLAS